MATVANEPGLLRLPLELRQKIYAHIFEPQQHVIDLYMAFRLNDGERDQIYRPQSGKQHEIDQLPEHKRVEALAPTPGQVWGYIGYPYTIASRYEWRTGILGVSKALSDEALDVLYERPLFVVNIFDEGHLQLAKFGTANLRRIRHLRILAMPRGVDKPGPLDLDDQLWHPVLHRLKTLWIVARQPLEAKGYVGAPTLEEDMNKWRTRLAPILQYLSENVSKATTIRLDGDERAETTALMNQFFAGRCKWTRTFQGDYFFKQRRYSHDPRAWGFDWSD